MIAHISSHELEQQDSSLQKKLDSVKVMIENGVDVWRNQQRKRYLESRLREAEANTGQSATF